MAKRMVLASDSKMVKAVALVRIGRDNEFIEAGEKLTLSRSKFRRLRMVGAVDFVGKPVDLGDEVDGSSNGSDDSDNGANPRIFGRVGE